LNTLARVALEKPEIAVTLIRTGDREAEAEAYAIRAAKAAYLADSTGTPVAAMDLESIAKVDGVNLRSSGFMAWLERSSGPSTEPVQQRCMAMVGKDNALAEVERLAAVRSTLIKDYLTVDKALPEEAILIRDRLATDTVQTGGQPSYHVLFGERGTAGPVSADVP
jgi:hypothetical protein